VATLIIVAVLIIMAVLKTEVKSILFAPGAIWSATFISLESRVRGGTGTHSPNLRSRHSFHAPDACNEIGAQESAIGSLIGQAPYGAESEIDGARRERPGLQVISVPDYNRLVEGQAGFGTVPIDELILGVTVAALGILARQTLKDGRPGDFKVGKPQNRLWLLPLAAEVLSSHIRGTSDATDL